MPDAIREVLDSMDPVRALAQEIAHAKAILFLGRHVGYPVALEGALKLKELAYMHAEGFPAGELKHGPIALVEDDLPVVVVMPSPVGRRVLHQKMLSNVAEVRARGARTIVIGEADDTAARELAARLHRGAAGADAALAVRHAPCRCRCSRPRSRGCAVSTSTSRATSRSRSRSNSGAGHRRHARDATRLQM